MAGAPSQTRAPELVVIGAGPVGLYAAYYAGFRGIRCTVMEALPFVGGQIAAFYSDSLVYDVPGFPEVRAGDLLAQLHAQASRFEPNFQLATQVTGIEDAGPGIRIRSVPAENPTAEPTRTECGAVLLTTGIGRFAPQRIPDDAIDRWSGHGLSYLPGPPDAYAGKRVLVAGGTQHGVDLAVRLDAAGADTTLIHRRERLSIPDALRASFDRSSVQFLPHKELDAIEGGAIAERAVLRDRRDDTVEKIDTDAILPCFGFAAQRDAIRGLPAEPGKDGSVPVDPTMAVGGRVWAAGDAADYPGKVRLLAADFGEACTAVNNITTHLFPGAPLFPGYSSHRQGEARRPKEAP